MNLVEIMHLMEEVGKKVKSMDLKIPSYPVVVFEAHQFMFSDIHEGNFFLSNHDIFEPEQPLIIECRKLLGEYEIMMDKIDSEDKGPFKNQSEKKRKSMFELKYKSEGIRNQLIKNLKQAEFMKPQFELRFKVLDMNAIQEIKKHPIVQEAGKTDMSLVSIRIVIG